MTSMKDCQVRLTHGFLWNGVDQVKVGDYEFIYSAYGNHTGVGVRMAAEATKCLLGYWDVSSRVIVAKFKVSPYNLTVVKVYVPRTDQCEEEIEEFSKNLIPLSAKQNPKMF